ncbi:MAG: hypothetical protein ACOYIR_01515 [Christensenellales bacterium]|jgi:hypothetical protein
MLSERLLKALMIAGSIVIAVCFVCILLLSRALSMEKDKQSAGMVQDQTTPVALPSATLNLLPKSGETSSEPVLTFAVFGGSADKSGNGKRLHEPALRNALSSIKEGEGAQFAVVLGDLASGSVSAEHAAANLNAWLDVATDYFPEGFFYPCFGLQESAHKGRSKIFAEHDDRTHPDNADKVEQNYKIAVFSEVFDEFEVTGFCHSVYGRTAYYFRRENCNFIVLNTKWYEQMDRVSKTVRDWIAGIAKNGADFNLIFLYGTPFPTFSVGMEMDAPYSTTTDDFAGKSNKEFRDEFWSLVEGLPGAIVFCGSEQLYARKTIDARYGNFQKYVFQISSAGLQGAFDTGINDPNSLDAGPYYREHYIIGKIHADRMVFEVKTVEDSAMLDSFVMVAQREDAG